MAIAKKNRDTINFKFLFGEKTRDEIRSLTTLNALKNLYENI